MGWYIDPDANAPTWQKRIAITVNNESGTDGNFDVETFIPTNWEAFWSVIDDAGNNIRITGPDGMNALAYDIDDGAGGAFDAAAVAARTGRIQIDSATCAADAISVVWLYYDPSAAATDGSSAVTITTPLPGVIEHEGPGPRQFAYHEQPPNSSRLQDVTHKAVGETVDIWIRLDHALTKLQHESENSRYFEEAWASTMSVIDSLGADQAAMYDVASNRFVWVQDRGVGEMWLRVAVLGGSNNTPYTVLPSVTTVAPYNSATLVRQLIQPRVGLSVRNTRYE